MRGKRQKFLVIPNSDLRRLSRIDAKPHLTYIWTHLIASVTVVHLVGFVYIC